MTHNGNCIKRGTRSTTLGLSQIRYSPVRTTERAFDSLPRKLRNMTHVNDDTFKEKFRLLDYADSRPTQM